MSDVNESRIRMLTSEIRSLATHVQHDPDADATRRRARKIRRHADRIDVALDPPVQAPGAERGLPHWLHPQTNFLHLGDRHARKSPAFPHGPGYSTTLHYFGLDAVGRQRIRDRLKERGYTHVFGFCRSGLNLRKIFGIDLEFDFLDDPAALVPILEETRADGIYPLLSILENDDHEFNRRHWESRLWPKIRQLLHVVYEVEELVDGILLGLEIDKSWGPHLDDDEPARPEFGAIMLNDAIGRPGDDPDRHIKGAFPDLGVAYQLDGAWDDAVAPDGFRPIPNADACLWQAFWPGLVDVTRERDWRGYLGRFSAQLNRVCVRAKASGTHLVLNENCQGPQFREEHCDEAGELGAEILQRHGFPATFMCGGRVPS